MKVRSAKAKGRDFQVKVANLIKMYLNLDDRDVVSAPASTNGVDILLSEDAKKAFPFAVECKKQESLNIWAALEQAERNSIEQKMTPLLIFSRNRSKTYAVVEFETLLDIINYVSWNKGNL